MNELIKINHEQIAGEQVNTVNAREIHAFLGIRKDFTTWVKVQIDRARLKENRDYVVISIPPLGGVEGNQGVRKEYHFTLDAGKHVAMMSGADKGFEVRDYFIECERRLHSGQTSTPDLTHNVKALYPHATKYLGIMNQSSEFDTRLCQTISDTFADYIKETNANITGTTGTPRRTTNPINPMPPSPPLKRGNTWQDIKAKRSKRNTITMSEEQIIEQIQTLTAPQKKRLFFILRLLKQKNQTADKLSQSELAEQLKINRKTIHNDMVMLIAGGLVKTNRGYCPTAAFPMFFERLMGD